MLTWAISLTDIIILFAFKATGDGDLSVEATVDIGTDSVAMVAGTHAVAQAVGDSEGEAVGEVAVPLQSKIGLLL